MSGPLTARPYESGDYEFVYGLKKLCYHGYVEALWGWKEDDQRRRFHTFMTEDGDGERMVILLRAGKAVGMVNWELPDENTLMLCNICLLPQCRGRGWGSSLLRELIEKCPRPIIQLQVYKTNPAVRLYERLGFRLCGETGTHYRMKRSAETKPCEGAWTGARASGGANGSKDQPKS